MRLSHALISFIGVAGFSALVGNGCGISTGHGGGAGRTTDASQEGTGGGSGGNAGRSGSSGSGGGSGGIGSGGTGSGSVGSGGTASGGSGGCGRCDAAVDSPDLGLLGNGGSGGSGGVGGGGTDAGGKDGRGGGTGDASADADIGGPSCPGATPPPAGYPLCRTVSDCPSGDNACQQDVPATSSCGGAYCGVNPPPKNCSVDSDCAAGKICVSKSVPCCNLLEYDCVAGCTATSCPADQRCGTNLHCEAPPSTAGYACAADFTCAPTRSDADTHGCAPVKCSDGYTCPADTRCQAGDGKPDAHGCVPILCSEGHACAANMKCMIGAFYSDGHGCTPTSCDGVTCPANQYCYFYSGASDGNFTSALGIPTLDGMGAVGEGAHARHESVIVEHLAPRTALLAGMLIAGI